MSSSCLCLASSFLCEVRILSLPQLAIRFATNHAELHFQTEEVLSVDDAVRIARQSLVKGMGSAYGKLPT